MCHYSLSGLRFKVFVKETNSSSEEKSFDKKFYSNASLTGDEVKEFYEDIIKEPSSSLSLSSSLPSRYDGKKTISEHKTKSVSKKFYKNSDLLRLAQDNDVKGLELFFATQCDYDVNIIDDFGWTPLMCASCSGAEEAVRILLQNGADVHRCDRWGYTAAKLARKKNNGRIVEMLERQNDDASEKEETEEDDVEPFMCETCKETFASKGRHETSTVHLLSCKIKTCTFYGIPESNKGFQLLLREGWNKESGLGKDGKGRKFPVKAVMKKDRSGIGSQPRPDENKRDGHHTVKYESKKKRLYKSWKDKDFEKRFRLEFS